MLLVAGQLRQPAPDRRLRDIRRPHHRRDPTQPSRPCLRRRPPPPRPLIQQTPHRPIALSDRSLINHATKFHTLLTTPSLILSCALLTEAEAEATRVLPSGVGCAVRQSLPPSTARSPGRLSEVGSSSSAYSASLSNRASACSQEATAAAASW